MRFQHNPHFQHLACTPSIQDTLMASAPTPRRRPTTYGKKPLHTSFDDFTTVAVNSILPRDDHRAKSTTAAYEKGGKIQHAAINIAPLPCDEITTTITTSGVRWPGKMDTLSASGSIGATAQKASPAQSVHELPFTGQEHVPVRGYRSLPQRKRKIDDVTINNSDDDSLRSTTSHRQASDQSRDLGKDHNGPQNRGTRHGLFTQWSDSKPAGSVPEARSHSSHESVPKQVDPKLNRSKYQKKSHNEGSLISTQARRVSSTHDLSRADGYGGHLCRTIETITTNVESALTQTKKRNCVTETDRPPSLPFKEPEISIRSRRPSGIPANPPSRGNSIVSMGGKFPKTSSKHCIPENSSRRTSAKAEPIKSSKNASHDKSPQISRKRLVDKLHEQSEGEYQESYSGTEGRQESGAEHNAKGSQAHNIEPQAELEPLDSPEKPDGSQALNPPKVSGSSISRSQARVGPYVKNLRVTYAHQRSYLSADLDNDNTIFNIHLVSASHSVASQIPIPPIKSSKPISLLSSTGEVDESQDIEGSTVKSIHELREAGGVARTVGEMEAILDDIEDNPNQSVSLKRSGLLDLATKLENPAATQLLFDTGLDTRFLSLMGTCEDLMVNVLLMISLTRLLISPSPSHTSFFITNKKVTRYLSQFLNSTEEFRSLASDRKTNMSKITRDQISNINKCLIRSSIWKCGSPSHITPRLLALHCLQSIVQQAREISPLTPVLSPNNIKALVDVITSLLSFPLQVSTSNVTMELHLVLSILESSTADSNTTSTEETIWTSAAIEKLSDVLPMIQQLKQAEDIGQLRALALRVCLNLTNNNLSSSRQFSKPFLVKSVMSVVVQAFHDLSLDTPGNRLKVTLDNLVLSLGLLINIVEWSEEARNLFLEVDEGSVNLLELLLQLFNTNCSPVSEVRWK